MTAPVGAGGRIVYVRTGEPLGAPPGAGLSELWQSDGTEAGTVRLFSGPPNAFPGNPVFARNRVLFTANDGTHGAELWVAPPPAVVVGRRLFYNNSVFDGHDPAANAADDAAVARDKQALLPGGGPASFANVSGYSRGINGIMLDLNGGQGLLTADDFVFRVGTGGDMATWTAAPVPLSVTHRDVVEAGRYRRFTVVWPDGVIRNQWLQVTVKANDTTGLTRPDVFYFGSLVGETGDSGGGLAVTARDFLAVRARLGRTTPITTNSAWDVNRDGRVSVLDLALVRANQERTLGQLTVAPPVMAAAPPPWRPWDDSPSQPLF